MRRFLLGCAAFATAMTMAVPAMATTYVGVRSVFGGDAELSITTDGALGVLTAANITDWTIFVTEGTRIRKIQKDFGLTLNVVVEGAGLTATDTDLLFDFDGGGLLDFAQRSGNFFGFPLNPSRYCVEGAAHALTGGGCVADTGGERIRVGESIPNFFTANFEQARTGVQVLASVRPASAAPEPTAWALMLLGFGAAGAAMRQRRREMEIAERGLGAGILR